MVSATIVSFPLKRWHRNFHLAIERLRNAAGHDPETSIDCALREWNPLCSPPGFTGPDPGEVLVFWSASRKDFLIVLVNTVDIQDAIELLHDTDCVSAASMRWRW